MDSLPNTLSSNILILLMKKWSLVQVKWLAHGHTANQCFQPHLATLRVLSTSLHCLPIIHKVNGYRSCSFQMKKHILNSLVLCLQKVTQLMNSNHKDFLSFDLPFKLLSFLKHVLKLYLPKGRKCIFKMNQLRPSR